MLIDEPDECIYFMIENKKICLIVTFVCLFVFSFGHVYSPGVDFYPYHPAAQDWFPTEAKQG